jgi:ketosteroid isomerase-like protein
MTEIIPPPLATRPDDACQLVCDALSDGDLDAALTYYQPHAVIAPPAGPPVRGADAIRELLRQAAATRMLYQVQPEQTLLAEDTALVTGRWTVAGLDTATNGPPLARGRFCTVLHRSGRGWQIVVEQMTDGDTPTSPPRPSTQVGAAPR